MVNRGYIKIQSFMCNRLDLKGNTLLVYAIIYEFTVKSKERAFHNSYSYISSWLSITRQQISQIVNELIRLRLIEKPYAKNVGRVKLKALSVDKERCDFISDERFSNDPSLYYLSDNKWVDIEPFMINKLKLSSHELIFFAAVWNLNKNGISPDLDSLNYLRSWSAIGQRTYTATINRLFKKGYLLLKEHSDGDGISAITENGEYW